jgi:hypothetical protein
MELRFRLQRPLQCILQTLFLQGDLLRSCGLPPRAPSNLFLAKAHEDGLKRPEKLWVDNCDEYHTYISTTVHTTPPSPTLDAYSPKTKSRTQRGKPPKTFFVQNQTHAKSRLMYTGEAQGGHLHLFHNSIQLLISQTPQSSMGRSVSSTPLWSGSEPAGACFKLPELSLTEAPPYRLCRARFAGFRAMTLVELPRESLVAGPSSSRIGAEAAGATAPFVLLSTGDTSAEPGTSRLCRVSVERRSEGGLVIPPGGPAVDGLTGKRVVASPLMRLGLRSRLMRDDGAGLVARLSLLVLAAMACHFSCSAMARPRSSVLIPRPRVRSGFVALAARLA